MIVTVARIAIAILFAGPASPPKAAATPPGAGPQAKTGGPVQSPLPGPTSSDSDGPAPTVPPSPTAPSPGAVAPDGGQEEVTRYQFTGLDIEGELRTPALLQFLTRIAGEFETMGIPHRSFMPELARTAHEDAL